jgi:hypothetical protein
MARFDKINDLYFTGEGDFNLGDNGDLEDTKYYAYRGFIQRVLNRMKSTRGDWPLQSSVGADLHSFIGSPNTKEIALDIQDRIRVELEQENLLLGGELQVKVFPTSKYSVAIALIINPPRSGGQVILTFSYDMRDNKLIPRNV